MKPIDLQTEKQFMTAVVAYARLCGWLCYHTYDSRKSVPGFPDLCMVRGGRLVFAELKRNEAAKKRVTEDQEKWIQALRRVSHHVEVYLWSPEDWSEIEEDLK